MRPTICAVIAVRNEAPYLRFLLPRLAEQGIDVAIIDHGSTDNSAALLRAHRGQPVLFRLDLPYLGHFSLLQQLEAKQKVIDQLPHDWVIHQDADEILEPADPTRTLSDLIAEADAAGDTVINFEEFCFIPAPDENFVDKDYFRELRSYYYFTPWANRLNRAWRRDANLQNLVTGGHELTGSRLRRFPVDQVLRHYIVLSQQHALNKYLGRQFAPADIAAGFHRNRQGLTAAQLRLPAASPWLCWDAQDGVTRLSRAQPTSTHFWAWA